MAIIKTGSKFTDGKNVASEDYVNNKVKTDVPEGAVFTDTNTVTTINGKTGVISKSDITALGIPAQDTTYNVATTSTNGLMSSTDKTKLDGISTGAQKNSDITKAEIEAKLTGAITSHTHNYVPTSRTVAGKALTGNITLAKEDVGLGNVDNTSDANKPVSTAQQSALNTKIDANKFQVVESLPASPTAGVFYFVKE